MPVSVSVRRAAAVALAVSALLSVAACGSSDAKGDKAAEKDGAKSSAPAASGTAKSSVTEAQLKAALLTEKDVPAGWKADPSIGGGLTFGKATKPECQKLMELMQSEPAPMGAAARQTSNFEYGMQQVFGFDGDKAAGFLKGFEATLAQCATFTVDMEGEKYPAAVKPLTVDKAGDEAHGYELVLDMGPIKMGLHNYVVRKGSALSTLSTKGKQPVGIPEADFKTVTATVAKKLDQAIKG
ncbi:lipoprotein [Streptomyces violascens]|uniref:Lipoprotein n=1 Tax=Streptomyces violascens TaxID=67381 RepID=A0ABQ3QPH7_9ACTN|nr:lipoprotein [Streptomyces violascens]GHI37963.1 lipoprotein [Streptomyces violascens]GHI39181.1 lipoprotein [Streptomyces violascens]